MRFRYSSWLRCRISYICFRLYGWGLIITQSKSDSTSDARSRCLWYSAIYGRWCLAGVFFFFRCNECIAHYVKQPAEIQTVSSMSPNETPYGPLSNFRIEDIAGVWTGRRVNTLVNIIAFGLANKFDERNNAECIYYDSVKTQNS